MDHRFYALFLAAACFACGGSSNPPPAAPTATTGAPEHGEHHEHCEHCEHGEHGEHHEMHEALSPALKDFHGVLAPVWHSSAGGERVGKACDRVKEMGEKAKATGDAELVADVAALDNACSKADRAEVEPSLTKVHERFHALLPKKEH